MKATAVGTTSSFSVSRAPISSYINDAIIIGIDIRKENSAASSRFVLHKMPADMVRPLRLNPGITAMPWAMPAAMEC